MATGDVKYWDNSYGKVCDGRTIIFDVPCTEISGYLNTTTAIVPPWSDMSVGWTPIADLQ